MQSAAVVFVGAALYLQGCGSDAKPECDPMTATDPCMQACNMTNATGCSEAYCMSLGKIGCDDSMCMSMGKTPGEDQHCMSPMNSTITAMMPIDVTPVAI